MLGAHVPFEVARGGEGCGRTIRTIVTLADGMDVSQMVPQAPAVIKRLPTDSTGASPRHPNVDLPHVLGQVTPVSETLRA